jgi:hypothetical protein
MPRKLAPCPSDAAYHRHLRKGEDPIPCGCLKAHREYNRTLRKQQGPTEREPAACGTENGYEKHLRDKTVTCPGCRRAHTDAVLARRHAKAARMPGEDPAASALARKDARVRIARTLRAAGMTQAKIAAEMGVLQPTVSRWLRS